MMKANRVWGSWCVLLGMVLAALCLTGCETSSGDEHFAEFWPDGMPVAGGGGAATNPVTGGVITGPGGFDMLNVGDSLLITFSDLVNPTPPIDTKIREDGTITLLHNQTFVAAGKPRGELEKEIRARYVPNYYVNLTVSIKTTDRFYFVGGEVKAPSRQIYLGPMTVLKAIQSCGDFTDFANKKKVKLYRTNGRTETINCIKALADPKLDLEVLPGDKVYVPRSIF